MHELLDLVGLAGYDRRSVDTLSGGEQQRVALARALAREPSIVLLDEPLGSLDRRLRDRLLDDLERLFDELRMTALYVTHDRAEAFALGDRVAVMRAGRVVQTGTPDEVWARPADQDIARFLGLNNVRDGTVVRPEAVRVELPQNARDANGVVADAVRQGPTVRLVLRLDSGETLEAVVADLDHPEPGDRVRVEVDERGVVRLPNGVRHRMTRRRVVVHGFVQGVFFRDTVRRRAVADGLAGWVRNNRDGTVEAVFEGDEGGVEALVTLCHKGPRGSAVERVDVFEEEPEGLSGFRIA